MMPRKSCAPLLLFLVLSTPPAVAAEPSAPSIDPREVHLADLRQLTFGGENAEAYWSSDGRRADLPVHRGRPTPATRSSACRPTARARRRWSRPARGGPPAPTSRPTAGGSSTRRPTSPAPPARRRPTARRATSGRSTTPTTSTAPGPTARTPVRLTDNRATTPRRRCARRTARSSSPRPRRRPRALPDGRRRRNVRRLTNTPGYDGGAFFSPDCSKIVWRASRPAAGTELEDYRRLLAQQPGAARASWSSGWPNADGTDARQVTYLGAASFAPSFFPAGKRIIFSSNYGDPKGREFDLWAVDARRHRPRARSPAPRASTASRCSRPTASGSRSRRTGTRARRARPTSSSPAGWPGDRRPTGGAADRFLADVAWLADDAREGRGVGTAGLDAGRADWLADALPRARRSSRRADGRRAGLQSFQVPVGGRGPGRARRWRSTAGRCRASDFQPAGFSAPADPGRAEGEVVPPATASPPPSWASTTTRDVDVTRQDRRGPPLHPRGRLRSTSEEASAATAICATRP